MKNLVHHITFALVVLGAINWGLVGLFDVNLVSRLAGTMPMLEKAIYILIGISGLVFAAVETREHSNMR